MKKLTLLIVAALSFLMADAANFKFLEHQVTQPDGTVIECYVSGDEFFNWIHDEEGYSIIKGSDGYYYYATKKDGAIVASKYRLNTVNPGEVGIKKWVKISKDEYFKRKNIFNKSLKDDISKAPHTGDLNNLVIYIRFSGETEIATTRQAYDNKLNPETGNSLKSYFKEVSYDQLIIGSTHYPDCDAPSTSNASYEDTNSRDYYRPYDESTNPDGYKTFSERTEREHQLLADAVTWVNNNYPVDEGLNIDGDDDGSVDNISFMIKGNADGWSDLLWAHRWALYTKNIYINGKRVYDFTFQPENQVSVRTLCHEMFHTLGAPDLYHYETEGAGLSPVGQWDIMEQGGGHMGAYMKWKYADGKWITDIPEITTSGTYNLKPLTSSTNNCYKIASPYATDEYFVLEYRKQSGSFESYVPGNGLLVYRINTNFDGNASYNGTTIFDEVYIYRPDGTNDQNGNIISAHFNSSVGRTSMNDGTNPGSFLSDGSIGGLNISEVSNADATISFKVSFKVIENPDNFSAVAVSETEINLSWDLNNDSDTVLLIWNESGAFGAPENGTIYNTDDEITGGGTVLYKGVNTTFDHNTLESGKYYCYKIFSVNASAEYSYGEEISMATQCSNNNFPLLMNFSDQMLPPCWQNIDNDGSGQVWEFGIVSDFGALTGDDGSVYVNSDGYGETGSQDADLVTPVFDLSDYTEIYIQFEHYFGQWQNSSAELFYSVNGGTSWIIIDSWTNTIGTLASPNKYSKDISAEVAGYSEVAFKWKYVGEWEYYWIIDDILITYDITNPDIVIESSESTETAVHPIPLSIIFSEAVFGFEIMDLELTNATADNFISISDSLYTVDIEPNQAGDVSVNIPANVAEDAAGNGNNAANILITYDIANPDVIIESSESMETTVHPIPLSIIFSEAVFDFEITDLELTNATADNFISISDSLYSVDIEPNQAGDVSVNIASNVAEDAVGNGNNAAAEWAISFDYSTGFIELNNNQIKIFPNPSDGLINLAILKEFKNGIVKIYDITGKLIFFEKLQSNKKQIDISDENSGMYILNIEIDNDLYSKKLIVK